MATINVFKRKDLKSPTWQYDVRDDRLNNGRKRHSGFKNKKDAQQAAFELVKELDKGIVMDNNITFKEYFSTWMKANNKHLLSPGQYDWYKRSLKLFIERFGEDKKVKDITKQEMQSFLTKYGEGKSDESVRKVHGCIAPALKDATYDGLIAKDPTYKLKLKGTEPAQREEDKFVTINQYLKLTNYFKSRSELSYIVLYLIAITGARFSEVNNMKWDDLNKGVGVIHLPGTKTDTSARDVEVAQKDIERVKSRLEEYPRRIDGYLFKRSNQGVSKAFKVAQKHIGMLPDEYVTVYALRHTHCSFLLSKGVAIEYISKRLGHSNIGTTLRVYSHLLDEYKKEQAGKVRYIYETI